MFIEKSPFHPESSKLDSKKNATFKNNQNIDKDFDKTFNFLKWFKGLINPLQNLPIISGIYSSINSEKIESDRDLVQNGLGGFIYGGPFGAIAGVGNWIFNKMFDKTPTELFFKVTGISNLWKNKDNHKDTIMSSSNKQNITKNFDEDILGKNKKKKNDSLVNFNIDQSTKTLKNVIVESLDKKKHLELNHPKFEFDKETKINDEESKSLNLSIIQKLYENKKSSNRNLNKIA